MKRFSLLFRFILCFIAFYLHNCEKDEKEDNQPPVCNIIIPADSSEFHIGDTITINVEAIDPDGLINAVLFHIDGEGKYSTTELPYQYEWITSNEIPGFHIIRATALDRGGNSALDECIINLAYGPPIVITADVSSLTQNSALSGGSITYFGNDSITARGVCWSISENPTISDEKTNDGSDTGSFISSITGLEKVTTYYVRAYATNSIGTAYGNQVSFTTNADLPVVNTTNVTSITSSSAKGGGNVTDDGGAPVTAKGVCWSISPNPVISDNHTIDGSGTGSSISFLTGLERGTTYYVRAYATNSIGTAYGKQVSFTTNADLPVVSTTNVTSITSSSAKGGGNVTDDGGAPVTAKGVCWSTSMNPTISDNITNDGSGTGPFKSTITGLQQGTTYYLRAYATNKMGTAYGNNESKFKTLGDLPCPGSPTVKDYDGNIYSTVQIGDQCWMKENLKTISYNDGQAIPLETDNSAWSNLSTPAYCYYSNDKNINKDTYGALYNWYTVNTGKLCPTGWHVPTDSEWTTLTNYLGGLDVAGGKLKETGTAHWKSPNAGATNETGFTALPGGYRHSGGLFIDIFLIGRWHSAAENNVSNSWTRIMSYKGGKLERYISKEKYGYSVRCIRD